MSKKPVYVVVTPFFPSSDDWTGCYCYDFVRAIRQTGRYEVFVFKSGDRDYEIAGVKVWSFRSRALPSSVFPFFYRKDNELSFLSALDRAGLSPQDVSICHGHTATYAIYPLAVKALNPHSKAILHHHDPQSFGLGSGILRHFWLYNMYLFPILRNLFEAIDIHVYVSEQVKHSFESAPDATWSVYSSYRRQMRWLPYKHVRVKKGIVLHNGVDADLFSKNLPDGRLDGTFTIGYVANFVDWKDPMSLLIAVHKLKSEGRNVRLKMLGGDSTLGRLQRLKGRLSLKARCRAFVEKYGMSSMVEFCPEVSHSSLPEFFRSIDLFVLPSYFEGFGCVFTESWSCGRPFITCEGQGMEDLIYPEDREKWFCKAMDPDDLAGKIAVYMDNRWIQRLRDNVEFKPLIANFLDKMEV